MPIKVSFLKCWVKIKMKIKRNKKIKGMKNWSVRCLVLIT